MTLLRAHLVLIVPLVLVLEDIVLALQHRVVLDITLTVMTKAHAQEQEETGAMVIVKAVLVAVLEEGQPVVQEVILIVMTKAHAHLLEDSGALHLLAVQDGVQAHAVVLEGQEHAVLVITVLAQQSHHVHL